MKLRRSLKFEGTLKKNFNELDFPNDLFKGMRNKEKKLIDWKGADLILEKIGDNHYVKYVLVWVCFDDEFIQKRK